QGHQPLPALVHALVVQLQAFGRVTARAGPVTGFEAPPRAPADRGEAGVVVVERVADEGGDDVGLGHGRMLAVHAGGPRIPATTKPGTGPGFVGYRRVRLTVRPGPR